MSQNSNWRVRIISSDLAQTSSSGSSGSISNKGSVNIAYTGQRGRKKLSDAEFEEKRKKDFASNAMKDILLDMSAKIKSYK